MWFSRSSHMHPVGLKQHLDDEPEAKPSGSRPPFRDTPSMRRRHSLDSAAPRKRRLSVESHGEFTVEDISHQDTGYDGDVEVVWPYQYEDAEGDVSGKQISQTRRVGLKRLEHDEISHSGLIDWMGSLHCDSDKEASRMKRGRKRKSRPSLDSLYRKPSIRSRHQELETGGKGKPAFTSKKPRRESPKSLGQASTFFDFGRTEDAMEDAFARGSFAKPTTEMQESNTTTNDSMDLD